MILFENKKDCCGCSACSNICPNEAIIMISDNEGFEYPLIDRDLCVDCKLCEKVCPFKVSFQKEAEEKRQKHIGIINLQHTPNYGAVIAAAVLEDIVRDIVTAEYKVNTIHYMPSKTYNNFFEKAIDEAKQWGGLKLYIKSFFPKSRSVSSGYLRNERFKAFRHSFLNLTKAYTNANDINADINYSAFITGSDIVWAPKKSDNFRADGYFLKFANKGELKIAYAPSLDNAVNKKLLKMKPCYQENLKHLDYISVREKSNVNYIKKLTDKEVHQCCDPALLVESDYYNKMLKTAQLTNNKEKYIYVYILEVNDEIVSFANKLAKEKGLKICYYSANHNNYNGLSEDCTADGPAEFLHRLKNAEYILTNSFHCVVFSLIFKKKFLSFLRSSSSIKSIDLLNDLDLGDRIATDKPDIDHEIDYEKVDLRLKEIREASLSYLKSSLENIR